MAAVNKVRTESSYRILNNEAIASMRGGIKKAALAGVGAVAVAGDQVKGFMGRIDKLAERGDEAQVSGRKALREFLTKRSEGVKKGAQGVTGRVENGVANFLGKLNVPTKSDIVELTRRIDSLTRKIDKL